MYSRRVYKLLVPLITGMGLCVALAGIFIGFQGSATGATYMNHTVSASTRTNSSSTYGTVTFPSFAGKVLHWTQINYNYTPNGPDPANRKAIYGDIWVIVGNDGVPALIQARYTLSDGTFLQEFTQTRQNATFFFNSSYHIPTGCSVDNQVSSTQTLLSALPRFVQETQLAAQKYVRVGNKLGYPLPTTAPLNKVQPLQTYNAETNIHSWLFKGALSSGMKHSYALDVNSDGRVIASEVKLFDAHGTLIQDSWHTYGQLQVYSSSSTLPVMSATAQGGKCNA